MKLSADQIAQYAAAAGFSGGDLSTSVAVALAESSGVTTAFNPEGSYGLWQIFLQAHPEFASWHLTDPASNARAAFIVYQNAGSTFRPWSTFNSGAYTRYMASAQSGVNTFMQAVQIAPGVTVLPPIQDIGANTSDAGLTTAAGQITQVPGWVWIAAGALGLMVWLQD